MNNKVSKNENLKDKFIKGEKFLKFFYHNRTSFIFEKIFIEKKTYFLLINVFINKYTHK